MKYILILVLSLFLFSCGGRGLTKYHFKGCNITEFKKTDKRAYWLCWRG